MTVVAKVTKQGYDVKTASDKNLVFSSELATHSIYNIISFDKPIGTTEVTYNHNLGYSPKTWVFALVGTAPNDYLRRVPTVGGELSNTDYKINDNQIVCYGESSIAIIFKVIVFTRTFVP